MSGDGVIVVECLADVIGLARRAYGVDVAQCMAVEYPLEAVFVGLLPAGELAFPAVAAMRRPSA
jgi:hypothetical protein